MSLLPWVTECNCVQPKLVSSPYQLSHLDSYVIAMDSPGPHYWTLDCLLFGLAASMAYSTQQ